MYGSVVTWPFGLYSAQLNFKACSEKKARRKERWMDGTKLSKEEWTEEWIHGWMKE